MSLDQIVFCKITKSALSPVLDLMALVTLEFLVKSMCNDCVMIKHVLQRCNRHQPE